MQIIEKHPVKSFGAYRVMEGTVVLEGQGAVRSCWVEDAGGNLKSTLTDMHTATAVADALARHDGHARADGDQGGDSGFSPDGGHGDSGGDGDGGGNGGD